MEQTKPSQSLPDNAYRELKPGEEYVPMMPADAKPKEVTPYSVTMGLLMAVLFSAAAAYLGLRIGQVFEAAIPIAIIAVGVGNMLGKKNMLGQNVIIQSIGASSGIIVAGAIFTLPALYILGLETAFYKVFLSSVLGGILGIVLLIPFRKYFVKEMHGKYPFPEATATTEVLVSGEKGGNQAKLLAVAGLVGGLYDFAASTFGLWTEEISTRMTAWGTLCADKFKTLLKVNTSAAVLGLGYIIGLKYSAIIAAGSFLIWLLVVPVVGSTATGAGMSPEELYQTFGRPLGIGGIAMAGLIGIIRQSGIIKQAMGLAVSEFSGKKKAETNVPRTQRDLTMRTILTTLIAALATTFFFFQFGILGNWGQTAVALLIGRSQRHRHRRQQPRFGYDPHDADPRFAGTRKHRPERYGRHDRRADYRRRGLHGPLDRRRLHHRPEDRLLDRHHAEKTGELEIPRRLRFGRYRRRRDDYSEQNLWLRSRQPAGSSAGQRDGRRDPTPDAGRNSSLGTLFLWRSPRAGTHRHRYSGPSVRSGHVPAPTAQSSAADRRSDRLVRIDPIERPGAQQGTHEPGYAHRVGLHRRRRPDGRSGSDPEIRRRGLEIHAVEQFERSLVGRSGHVSGAYHLFRRTFAPR
jgi:hypothetical protein